MPLSSSESRLCSAIAKRSGALLDDLRVHVALPTGGNNAPALDETRERLSARLMALGARVELVPGDPAPDWLFANRPDAHVPPTAICRYAGKSGSESRAVLIAVHLDTVHDRHLPTRRPSQVGQRLTIDSRPARELEEISLLTRVLIPLIIARRWCAEQPELLSGGMS